MKHTIVRSYAVRAAALLLISALAAGCSGTGSRLLPLAPGTSPGVTPAGAEAAPDGESGKIATLVRIRIPRRSKREHVLHPATISPLTQSLTISVNGGAPKVFNTTPASPGCSIGAGGNTTCTFRVQAKAGTDTFAVTTYAAVNGAGIALDRGVVTVPIKKGKPNSIAVTLGPVVTTTADAGMGSLRYAVGSANAGDTIMFLLPAGSTIALATPITISGTLTIAGPGASSLSISGGGTHQIFVVTGGATISGLTLTQGKAAVAAQPGGAIYNVGSVTLANDVIGNSTSVVAIKRVRRASREPRVMARLKHPHCTTTYNEGGALYNNGIATISGTTFTGNVIQSNVAGCIDAEGGAVYNDQLGSLTSTGDTYSNNSAISGGAVYNAGLGLVSFTNDTFSGNTGCTATSGCPTSGCSTTSCTSFAIGVGAAIFDHGLGVTVVNSSFTNNVAGGNTPAAQGDGGAIYLDSNSVLATITGSTFTGNVAGGGTSSCSSGEGGAIVAANPIELDNDTFKNNAATGDQVGGGGAIVTQMSVTGTGDTFTGNTAVGSGGACTTSAEGIGGAVYSGAAATFNNSTFTSNSASANNTAAGGAVAAVTTTTINNSTFTSNTVTSTGADGATSNSADGGAVVGGNILKITGSTFTSNAASLAGPSAANTVGGAAFSPSAIVSTNSVYKSNSVASTAPVTAAGGAVGVLSGTWISNGDTFTSNSASSTGISGAGAAVVSSGGCIISNTTVTSNTATGAQGIGGGLVAGGACHLTHDTITGNVAAATSAMPGGGGGLLDSGGATISDTTISGNSATTEGGGIVATSAETITNSSISGNTVTNASLPMSGGGGIVDSGGVALENVTIANNTVTIGGPGPAGGAGIQDGGGVLMFGSTISGNKLQGSAPNSGGGGIYTTSGMLAENATIGNNTSSVDGGGVYLAASATASVGNVTMYKNTATGNGGNLNIGASAAMTLVNTIVAGGSAAAGPDAYNANTFTSNGNNIVGSAVTGYTAAAGDLPNTDPKLLPLANNGGATFTFADQAPGVSPGTQHITFSGSDCGTVVIPSDQRGFTRGAGGKCDVGAYEYAGVASAIRHRSPHALRVPHFARHASSLRLPVLHFKPFHVVL